ncbi:MAG: HAMP domain-containing histidine kinase [Bacteroidetes bacterium]|nr:HAMP domain-containing histidine kinase [Bacteroidota bacterium]MBU1114703.1 HAMP domain-containing histidine kinase [Bacteroidota bacterium]MBU1798905.1 HAMP domain-containing histidine kinase [Bacteroidota bacterium]
MELVIKSSKNSSLQEVTNELFITPLQLLASLLIVAGVFALMFEVKYFADFSIKIYLGRLIATLIGFLVLLSTNFRCGKDHPIILIHILLITIITSFVSIILLIPESIFINSQLLSLIVFTSALFLSWDVKNQIIVAIYYNILFAASILLNSQSIYFLPSFFAAFLFVIFISILSIVAAAINLKLRSEVLEKSIEAKNYLDNASEGIFKISTDGTLLSVNPAFVSTLKYENKKQLISQMQFSDFFTISSDYDSFISKLSEGNAIHDEEYSFQDFSKREISVIINARIIKNKREKIIAIEGSILDITERVIAQKKIKEYNIELEKLNNSKDKFFSIVAHDLISPFTSLIGFSEIMYNEANNLTREEVKEFSGNIFSVATKAHNLLENLLSWSSIQSNRMLFSPRKFNVYSIVEDIILLNKGNAHNKGISLHNEIPEQFEIVADFNMLNAIIRNLVSNSVKFTKAGGKISVGLTDKNDNVEFYIEDTGVGMSDEHKNKLFKIDVHHSEIGTNNEKGTGLGLVLCAEFVAKHNGTIHVESELGKGSKFYFTIKKDLAKNVNLNSSEN